MPRFFVPTTQIAHSQAIITGAEFHHLRHVLRLTRGDTLTICDDRGQEHQGSLLHLATTEATVAITASAPVARNGFSLTLALGVLKGQKLDLVIEKATELGVRHIIPFFSACTVAQLPTERRPERLARWQRLAHSAVKQSGSPVPHISPPYSFQEMLEAAPQSTSKLLFYEKEHILTLRAFAQAHPTCTSVWVVVGPEGGFSLEEIEYARAAGFHLVGLGRQILRAETAGIVVVALCQFLWGDANTPLLEQGSMP